MGCPVVVVMLVPNGCCDGTYRLCSLGHRYGCANADLELHGGHCITNYWLCKGADFSICGFNGGGAEHQLFSSSGEHDISTHGGQSARMPEILIKRMVEIVMDLLILWRWWYTTYLTVLVTVVDLVQAD